jgi:hypothetical protein
MNAILYIFIGLITGISIGIVGIGAGILLMPLLISSGVSIHTAVATGLALQLIPQSFPGLWLYYKKGHVNILLSFYVIIGSAIGIYIGSYIVNHNYINELLMYRLLFIILILSSIYIGLYYI